MTPYKIVAICQVFNELEKGNLERFVTFLLPLVDELVVYDDGSNDGSYEYLHNKTRHIIRGSKNDFLHEVAHRKQLVEYALTLSPDYILWLDADEVLTRCSREDLNEICSYCDSEGLDGIQLHEVNLWRSRTWRRMDSLFDDGWFTRIWKVSDKIRYSSTKSGLHQAALVPPGIKNVSRIDNISVLHYGFSSMDSLAEKYITYKANGQTGYEMLDRIIDEHLLITERVPETMFPVELWDETELDRPIPILFEDALKYVEEYKKRRNEIEITVVCLIYKSTGWAQFVYEQFVKYTYEKKVEFYFVVNNGLPGVAEYLTQNYIPFYEFNSGSSDDNEWYINKVYRAYNYGATKARGKYLVFINSDMAFSPFWLDALRANYDGNNCLVPRLVESGRLRSGKYGVERNFGFTPNTYKEKSFIKFYQKNKMEILAEGGLYMPLFIDKRQFESVGGYPEGNVNPSSDFVSPVIVKKGEPHITGDRFLIDKLKNAGVRHQTVFSSLVYHFQMGEMLASDDVISENRKLIALCNDLVTGTMGERVFWDHFLEYLPNSVGVDKRIVGKSQGFEKRAKKHIKSKYKGIQVIVQNASFIQTIDPSKYTIAFLQDNLRAMNSPSQVQERNLRLADKIVTNSVVTAASYPEFSFEIIPIGIDDTLFSPKNKIDSRRNRNIPLSEKVGIFVGAFTDAKGWPKIKECIDRHRDILWIVISKYDEVYNAPNVRSYNRVSQEELVELLNCSDFFILGSLVETQCLAAIEACLCNIPVIMNITGIFSEFSEDELNKCGVWGPDFDSAIVQVYNRGFSPRDVILSKGMTISACMKKWYDLLTVIQMERRTNVFKEKMRQKRKSLDFFACVHPFLYKFYLGINNRKSGAKMIRFLGKANTKLYGYFEKAKRKIVRTITR